VHVYVGVHTCGCVCVGVVCAGGVVGRGAGLEIGDIEGSGFGPYPKYGLLLAGPGVKKSSLVGR
jgi:hypothetical protein